MSFNIDGLDKLQDGLKNLVQTGVNELNKGLDRINNPEESRKANVPENCPYCGAKLNTASEESVIKCEYCGAEFDNGNERTIADSFFDFVEKQQKIAMEQKEKEIELAKIKAEEKAAKRAARRKRAFKRNIFLLVVIVIALMYYYYYYMR